MKKILLITLSNIGDVIMTTPVIMALAEAFPGARLTVVCGPKAEPLLRGSRFIDRLAVYDKKANPLKQAQFLFELRKESYDCAIDLRNTVIPFLVRARRRSPLFRKFREKSMPKRHLEVLKKMGIPAAPALPPFDFFNAREEEAACGRLRNKGAFTGRDWIVVSPGAASRLKTWNLEGFREVVRRLLEERSEEIILVGDLGDKAAAEAVADVSGERIYNLAGETTLRELAAVVSRASLVLSNDSAVMHLAYELDRPAVAVFGPTHPEKYGRSGPHFRIVREEIFCSPCERSACRFERQACFEDLNPEKVFRACQELLHVPSA